MLDKDKVIASVTLSANPQVIKEFRNKLKTLITDIPIGSDVKIDDVRYLVVEDVDKLVCQGCDLCNKETGACMAIDLLCYKYDRQDGKDVIFKKIETQGD